LVKKKNSHKKNLVEQCSQIL